MKKKNGRNYTMKTNVRGHWLRYDEISENWYLEETDEKYIPEMENTLVCPKCDKKPAENGHDACMMNVPNVEFACCGHGIKNTAYLKYTDGTIKRFKTTEKILEYIKQQL